MDVNARRTRASSSGAHAPDFSTLLDDDEDEVALTEARPGGAAASESCWSALARGRHFSQSFLLATPLGRVVSRVNVDCPYLQPQAARQVRGRSAKFASWSKCHLLDAVLTT